jgi:prepilin-type N-terminal cleavage/methylation domain-containing protein
LEIGNSKFRKRRAFTLIEIMVAVMVFGMVIAAIYATWALVMRATQVGQDAAARAQRQRVVLRSIEDALMGIQSFQASQNYYWFRVDNQGESFLSFAARLPESFPRDRKFVGSAFGKDFSSRRVTFSVVAGANGENDLILRQNPILMDMDQDEQQYPLVLAHNVKTFTVECWDTNKSEWLTEWENTNSIPPMLRVNLVLGAKTVTAGTTPEFAAARIFTVPSGMMPAAVQRGGAGGPGGPGIGPGGINLPTPPGAGGAGGNNLTPPPIGGQGVNQRRGR